MRKYPLPKNDRITEASDVAEYCAKMSRELSDMALASKLDFLGYLLVLAQKEAEAQVNILSAQDGVDSGAPETKGAK
ncbi:hypothetical protein PsAD2_04221 [Pseudovibrio axinellae]|uniref:Uncharacterized protein n=1 Tax=Pseudovibrio axinellae TaxID=989403 RepID=A0A165TW88_9HYPH|nr:hypothetical protein [Pseudovibrio axinellae]KZL06708.1 hypothetical protein PsAD2_04221 [Pseudovibrio axinellae]SER61340.1 hypothetical protein SAMN05421798_11433 [Pseudovibrio axinellae]